MKAIDAICRSRFTTAIAWVVVVGCGGTPREAIGPTSTTTGAPAPDATRPLDPDLHRPPPRKLLTIDWPSVKLTTEADALALWRAIAPTGEDWDDRLEEVPAELARPLAIAMLHGGQFTCMKPVPPGDCAPLVLDVDPPAHAAGLADPCLRRMLALWSIAQLEPVDAPAVMDALRAIVAIPPPESQLVAAAMQAVPESDQAARLALAVIAWGAGQKDLANSAVGKLDEPLLIEAATKHHIDGALEILSAKAHRATYLAAVTDEALGTTARTQVIGELVGLEDPLTPDVKAALVKATSSKDCTVAAVAARWLEQRGDKRFVPRRPRAQRPEPVMRALCVLASYEQLQRADESSLLATYVPAKGLERVMVAYDALAEVDTDGDGDPHTQRTVDLVPRDQLALPELDDLVRALRRCTGTVCTSPDREFRLTWKPLGGELVLSRLEIVERPPCRRP